MNRHASPNIVLGDILIDLTKRTASINGMPIHFTRYEYSLLELLAFRRGETVDREAMLSHLFCYEAGPTGYGLYRLIIELGHSCMVVAPIVDPTDSGVGA